jgi:hypothetical protein
LLGNVPKFAVAILEKGAGQERFSFGDYVGGIGSRMNITETYVKKPSSQPQKNNLEKTSLAVEQHVWIVAGLVEIVASLKLATLQEFDMSQAVTITTVGPEISGKE